MNVDPYQRYKEESVMTMTAQEMLLLLYDELLKRLRAAELLAKKEDYDMFDKQMTRCEEIVRYLRETLDYEYSISADLYRMYDFFLVELSRIRISRDAGGIDGVRPLMQELRDAFSEAEKKVKE